MSRYRKVIVAVAGLTGLASGCQSCSSNRCSLLSRSGCESKATLTSRGDCPPAGAASGPIYYGDPMPVGIPTSSGGAGVRPENELPMPNQNIAPPANPIPVGLPAAMPGKGK
ncbi:MAG TPA: hypothetical protein VGJ05_19320 [Fimbriiglobus sp.]|jgi:hypothetical protein